MDDMQGMSRTLRDMSRLLSDGRNPDPAHKHGCVQLNIGRCPYAPGVKKTLATLAAATMIATLGAQALAAPARTSLDPYFPLDGNPGIDALGYRVKVAYDFDSRVLRGTTRIRLKATQDLSAFNLDFLLDVDSVRVDGAKAAFQRQGTHELTITPATALAADSTHTVVVRYADRPGRHHYAGEQNWNANRREVVAINEPHMAPWWFPSNDHPSDKALMDITVAAPAGMQAIANGRQVSRKKHGQKTLWRWRSSQPMATYLAFFALGHFQIERGTDAGVPWVNAVSRGLGKTQSRFALKWLRRTPTILRWLVKELGPYPFDSAGGLVTSLGFGFALENQTRPVYPWAGTEDWLLVHELAHQWFGDSVSVSKWQDIWLNEGFATYAEQRWAETHGGATADKWLRHQYAVLSAGNEWWRISLADPGAETIFESAIYLRGGMALVAWRRVIGPDTFANLLRTWVSDHRLGHGTTAEFQALAEQVSGQDLYAFFAVWLAGATPPPDTAAYGLG